VGSLSQLGGITRFEFSEGKAKGASGLRVRTAAGLDFTVVPEKGLDITEAYFQGKSLCWQSPAGVVHPAFYDCRGIEWLKTFAGGLITTCGLTAAGAPSEDQGEALGLHGSIANTPAENVSHRAEWEGDELLLTVAGSVRESRVFGANLAMHRSIQTRLSGCAIQVNDTVCNEGYKNTPLLLVYHMNYGFPFVTEHSRIYGDSVTVEGRTEFAKNHLASWATFAPPTAGIDERVYYHSFRPDAQGNVTVVLVSNEATRDLGIEITYAQATLPQFVEWKMPGVTHYVLGLEPANCRVDGRAAERAAGRLQLLAPGEERKFGVTVRVLATAAEVAAALSKFV
jgi:galactose mutarotase-like enzyme